MTFEGTTIISLGKLIGLYTYISCPTPDEAKLSGASVSLILFYPAAAVSGAVRHLIVYGKL